MNKTNASGFASLVIIVVISVAVVLAGAYFAASRRSRNDDQQAAGNTESASRIDADKPLDTAAGNIADDVEKEINALAEDDYSDSGLSDTALYE